MKTIKAFVAAALCAVGITAFAEPDAVQLWEGGPLWATCNVGAEKPADYGILTNFNDAAQVVTDALGEGWRLPTDQEFEDLLSYCEKNSETCKDSTGANRAGWRFTGKGDYSSNSIFLPAAGSDYNGLGRILDGADGEYWSSVEQGSTYAYDLYWYECDPEVSFCTRSYGLSVRAVKDPPVVVAQFVKGGEVVAEFETAADAVAALDDAQYADIEEFRIGLTADTVFDFGGRTNRVVILNVGEGVNTLKNVLLDCAGDYVVTGMVGTVVFGDGVRIEKSALDFKQGWVNLIIKGGLYKNDPIGYCEDGYLSARRYDENEHLNGLYAVLPAAEIAVEDRKGFASTRYATLQDAFNLIGENEDVTLRLFSNLELGTAVTKLEGNKVIHLLPSESGANTIKRVGAEPVIEIGREAKLEIKNVIFDGANFTSEEPMIEVAGKTGTKFGWLIAGDGFVVSNAVGGAVHVGNGGKFELDGVAKIIENTTGGKPKNVIIEDKQAIVLKNGGAVTDGNYAQIGVYSDTDKFMIPGGQFGAVDLSYEYATYFSDGDISVAEPKVGFINDRDGTLHHAAGAKIAAAPMAGEGKKTYKRWVGGEYKVTLEEGDYLISRVSSFPSSPTYLPELIWTARQDAPAAQPAPAVLDWTDTTLTLAVSNGCDYALVTSGSAETNWVSMVKTDSTYAFARPAGDLVCLRRYSITPSNIVSAATAYNVRIPAGTEDDPWLIGTENPEDMVAYTNGTEFVVGGAGTVPSLANLAGKVTVESLKISNATVTGAEDGAFTGFSNVSLTLPDGWQGELPDEDGNWYGATVNLMGIPLSVRNVTFLQRYPWNGKVDVGFTLTGPAGETNVVVTVCTNGTKIADFTAAVTIPADGVLATNLVWDAATAGLAANFESDAVTVEVALQGYSAEPSAVQLWEGGPFWAESNLGESDVAGHPEYGAIYTFDNATNAVAQLTDGWRLPTKEDFENLQKAEYCTMAWTQKDGVYGYLFTGKTTGYTDKSIILPPAGYDRGIGLGRERYGDTASGFYWSSTAGDSGEEMHLQFFDGYYNVNSSSCSMLMSVRVVRDTPPPPPPPPPVFSKSAAGTLELRAGDRIAAGEEPLVVDPAWGEASEAQVQIDGEGSARTYASASIDTWNTASLEPGRYAMALTAGTDAEVAAFWKTGADWVVFDSSNITADVTFEAGKTYLVLGTNMVNGATLTVEDGAKFEYDQGAPAGFNAGFLEELPKRYETTGGVDPADERNLYQIVEKIKGCEDNPWDIGEGVTAYTNGTELVIGGEGAVEDLSEIPAAVKDDVKAITIADATVTGAAEDVFAGVNNVDLTLPDNWQGELPDEDGNWYGATGVELTRWPMAVKNVKPQQRYPWNGLVDINFNLTGEGMVNVAALVTTNGVALANPTVTSETVFDLGGGKELKNLKLVWDAKADLPANFTCDDVVIEVTAGRQKTDGDYMVIDLSADGNGRFAVSYEDMDVASAIEKYNTDEYKTGKLVLKKIPAGTAYPCEPRMIDDVTSAPIGGTMTPTNDYFIGLFETTAAQYDRVMGVETPSDATTPKNYISYNMIRGGDDSPDIEPTDPVAAESFMGILAAKTGVAGFDLPTEIQWEIAARAGSTAEYGSYLDEGGNAVVGTYDSSAAPWGNTTNFMWFAKNNNPADVKSVGLLRPNLWGLYDTAGNIYEFCLDVYNEDKTSWDDVETPEADGDSYKRALRGGYFAKAATVSRPSVRSSGYSDGDGINIGAGFRLCRTVATAGSSTSATATSISEAFAVDLREEIALAEGEVEVGNITWSDTVWGEDPASRSTDLGWTNMTTGAAGVLATGLHGPDMAAFDLPTVDGEYRLTHSAGDLTSFVTFVVSGYPFGSAGNPWKVGSPDPEDTVAWTNGNGVVYFKPALARVTKDGLETIAAAAGGSGYVAKLVGSDGSATNDVVTVIGESGAVYDTIAEALAAGETVLTLAAVSPLAYLDWDADNGVMTNAVCYLYEVMTDGTDVLDAGMTYAVTADITLSERINVKGTPENPTRLILCDGTMLTAEYGVDVPEGYALAVYAQSEEAGTMGALTAMGDDFAAALGGDWFTDGGSFTFNGGNVTVSGGCNAAGIGGGLYGAGGDVTVNGGVVNAFAGDGDDWYGGPAGIGGGSMGYGGEVVVNGGSVTSVGGYYGAGIGGGSVAAGGYFTLNGGQVLATGGAGAAGIGGGLSGIGSEVAINGGTLTAFGGILAPAIGAGYGDDSSGPIDQGTVVFGDGVPFVLKAGDDEASAGRLTVAEYTDDFSAAYVAISSDGVILAVPEGDDSFAYVVTNETAGIEVAAAYADGTNRYVFASNDTYSVNYTLAEGYEWDDAPAAEPLVGTILADLSVEAVSTKLKSLPFAIPALPEGLVCVVSNETSELTAETESGTNTYTVTYGDKVTVFFSPADGYRFAEEPAVNPVVIDGVKSETAFDASAFPAVKSLAEESAIGDSDVTWKIEDGVLVIDGSGEMPDFDAANPAPWNEFADKITAVSVGEEVEHLGDAAFYACTGATSITLANEEGMVNLAAFVSPDGSETSFPENVFIIEDGEKAKAVSFEGDADEDYDSLDAAYAAGETDVAPLTLNNLKAALIEDLEEVAGPEPRTEEMQKLVDEAVEAILAVTTPEELETVAEEQGAKISAQAEKESPTKIGDSDVTWKIEDGVLVISGEGEMPDFDEANPAPWDEFADEITSVEIGEEVTKLGAGAFGDCENLAEVILASDGTPVNPAAFSADGETVGNEPKLFVRNAEGGLDEVLEYQDPDDDETVYESLDDALADGVKAVEVVTLPKAKAEAIAALTDFAGENPSEAVQQLLASAVEAIEAAESLDAVGDAAEAGYLGILTQLAKEKPQAIAGTDLTWQLVDGELVIEGEGAMPDFDDDDGDGAPWEPLSDLVKSVKTGADVASLGNGAFALCENLESMQLGNAAMPVNLKAFIGEYYDDDLGKDVATTNLPATVTALVDGAEVTPAAWLGDDGEEYATLADALAAGCASVTAVLPEPEFFLLYPDGDGGVFVPATKSSEKFDGVLLGETGVEGTIQLKLKKPNKRTGLFDIQAKVRTLVDKASYTFKAKKVSAPAEGVLTVTLEGSGKKAAAHTLVVTLDGDSLTGSFDGFAIDGARDVFALKGNAKREALNPYVATWTGAFALPLATMEDVTYVLDATFSAKIKASGKAVVKLIDADGRMSSCSTKAEVGADGRVAVPVTVWRNVNGAKRSFGFRFVFDADGAKAVDVAPFRDWSKKSGGAAVFSTVEFDTADRLTVKSSEFKSGYVIGLDPEAEALLGPVAKNGVKLDSYGLLRGTLKWNVVYTDARGREKRKSVSGKAAGVMIGTEGTGSVSVKLDGVTSSYGFSAVPAAAE